MPDSSKTEVYKMKLRAFLIAGVALASVSEAQDALQPYKGFEAREITSLSEQDIAALLAGSGWGLALPAELNGFPGPLHVLELADELGLSKDQEQSISKIFEEMRKDAIAKGVSFIEAERTLDEGFKSPNLDAIQLKKLIENSEAARADLRFVHLSRHLMTLDVLSSDQIDNYAVLRGYASDPCSNVPDGHDATMWKRHNGCGD